MAREGQGDVITRPTIGKTVLVHTSKAVEGQLEHAAIITGVGEGTEVDVLLMPRKTIPYPVSSIQHFKSPAAGPITWRWPPRV